MRRTLSLLAVVAGAVFAANAAGAQQAASHAYVGAKGCAMCHKTEKQGLQAPIWEKSKHAQAFTTLTTPAAAAIAKTKGIDGSPAAAPACLKCHTIVGDAKAEMKDGVQCESCHGAGADYKGMAVMKVKADAVAKGMMAFADKAAIEAMCKTCHNAQSPTFKDFNFDERWAKIAHKKPAA